MGPSCQTSVAFTLARAEHASQCRRFVLLQSGLCFLLDCLWYRIPSFRGVPNVEVTP